MKKLVLLLAIVAVGIGTALTYHVFENAVHASIDLIWYDWFNTDSNRLLVIPLAVVLSLAFFGLQHLLDKKSEKGEEEGLGNMPDPTAINYLKVLLIGLFSLLAGAALGPEAVLVPACMILGAYVGTKISKDKQVIKLLSAAGIIALFTAFFHSFLVGIISLALVTKQAKTKLNPILLITAIIASAVSYWTLRLVSGESFAQMPDSSWQFGFNTLFAGAILAVAGYLVVYGMHYAHQFSEIARKAVNPKAWWVHALLASSVISALYLIGGPLVEFTGNRSIVPMFDQAAGLGLVGLIWILIVKTVTISWSKAIGYRGGMIFPTIFLAAVLVAIAQLYVKDIGTIYGIIAVLTGAFIANGKVRILV